MNKTAIILSGGMEIISAAIVEEFLDENVDFAVVSIVENSILKVIAKAPYKEIIWPPENTCSTLSEIIDFAEKLGATKENRLPIIATEDGGLRFLFENADVLSEYLIFGGARNLTYGGLDKAELFSFLDKSGVNEICVPTLLVLSPLEALETIKKFKKNCIVKPSMKPLSMNMGGMKGKAIAINDDDSDEMILERLQALWSVSERWVVQKKLTTPETGEFDIYFVRNAMGELISLAASELWKQPRVGGTGCWVESLGAVDQTLLDKVDRMLSCIGFVGAGEISFLVDGNGHHKMIELNARPWLQIGLASLSGVPMAYGLYRTLTDQSMPDANPKSKVIWVSFERIIIAALSGEYGFRLLAIIKAIKVVLLANSVAVWGSALPGLRSRWLKKMLFKMLSK